MGRKLTSWERQEREQERNALRRKRAREVAARRENARKEKERKLASDVKAAENEVKKYDNFFSSLTNLHNHAIGLGTFNTKFSKPLSYSKPKAPVKLKNTVYKEKTFKFTQQSKLTKVKKESSYNFEQYCKSENRISFFLIVLLAGTKNDHKEYLKKKSIELEKLEKKKKNEKESHLNKEIERKKEIEEQNKNKLATFEQEMEKYETRLKTAKEKFSKEEEKRVDWYSNLKNGKKNEMETACEFMFPLEFSLDSSFEMLNPTDVSVGYEVSNSEEVKICINFPEELEFLPEKGIKMTPSGKGISEFKISQKVKNEVSNRIFCSIAFTYLKAVFNVMKSVDKISIEVGTNGTDPKTGGAADMIFLVMNVNSNDFKKIKLKNIDVLHAIENFDHKYRSSNTTKNIEGQINRDNLTWATDDDSNIKVSKHLRNSFRSSFY